MTAKAMDYNSECRKAVEQGGGGGGLWGAAPLAIFLETLGSSSSLVYFDSLNKRLSD